MTKSLDAATRRGREDAKKGVPRENNPYKDKRKPDGRLTWSRAYVRAWFEGWDSEVKESAPW